MPTRHSIPTAPLTAKTRRARSQNWQLATGNWQLLRHRGFNFIEILFAVILLGLGFIMIAGVFPVALKQTTQTATETTAALVVRDALRDIQNAADVEGAGTTFAQTPNGFTPIPASTIAAVGGNQFYASDPRYAWVAFYRRINATDPYAQVVVIVLQNPNFADPTYPLNPLHEPGSITPYNIPGTPTPTFNPLPPPIPSNYAGGGTATISNTAPQQTVPSGFYVNNSGTPPYQVVESGNPPGLSPINANLFFSPSTGNSYIFLNNDPNIRNGADPVPNAVTGAFVLIANDTGNAAPSAGYLARPANEMTGRVLRLGAFIGYSDDSTLRLPGDLNLFPPDFPKPPTLHSQIFALAPGWDLTPGGTAGGTTQYGMENTGAASNSADTPAPLPVYIMGAAPEWTGSITNTTGLYTGPNQDVAAVSSYIRINTAN